ncbi:MAG: hypothetical protein EZS28_037032 [Streblomastix strix]|uniref:Uncharacterized protein n=1 Tax=Streblomastix strix TaxID=222440 RepID=A0A5J4UBZ6_9EUKA|nr:MAG: hypothetical protein EZS28_037032 [Streblomastix strix]
MSLQSVETDQKFSLDDFRRQRGSMNLNILKKEQLEDMIRDLEKEVIMEKESKKENETEMNQLRKKLEKAEQQSKNAVEEAREVIRERDDLRFKNGENNMKMNKLQQQYDQLQQQLDSLIGMSSVSGMQNVQMHQLEIDHEKLLKQMDDEYRKREKDLRNKLNLAEEKERKRIQEDEVETWRKKFEEGKAIISPDYPPPPQMTPEQAKQELQPTQYEKWIKEEKIRQSLIEQDIEKQSAKYSKSYQSYKGGGITPSTTPSPFMIKQTSKKSIKQQQDSDIERQKLNEMYNKERILQQERLDREREQYKDRKGSRQQIGNIEQEGIITPNLIDSQDDEQYDDDVKIKIGINYIRVQIRYYKKMEVLL